jgi:hypothetical protein
MVDQLAEISLLPQHYNQSQNLSTVDQNYLIIPQGVKENVYFVINDTENRIRRQNKKYIEYSDNCGAWQKGKNSTKSHD